MNRLAGSTSPYLRQHADNPVDWYPWGEEAFARAAELDRPVFVSIGYSACHWCHVMAHESFEDPEIARQLNEQFVSVKVDREEHPDVDAIYMEAVQTLTGGGGWPLTVFCGPDRRPFFGGTYFPNVAKGGMPAFTAVLDAVRTAWDDRRDQLDEQARELTEAVSTRLAPPAGEPDGFDARTALLAAAERFSEIYDHEHGGVGRAPKFPQAPMLELLLRADAAGVDGARSMVETTLAAMASGGIYDHLGGGFARYSVDRTWTIPHFEKMLYDQAALARCYLHAYLVTGDERWSQVVTETVEYVLRDLSLPDGGLASAEDADAEGEEGRFSTWTSTEARSVLEAAGLAPEEVEEVLAWYGLDGAPNFEGRLYALVRAVRGDLVRPPAVEAGRVALFEHRERRVRPQRDDKALTEWNAMFASVLAEAGAALERPDWIERARSVGRFLLDHLRRQDGRWLRSYQGGTAAHLAVASDYAWLCECFTRLGELSGEASWIEEAQACAHELDRLFGADDGGFYLSGADAVGLPLRPRDSFDGVLPAAVSVAAGALGRLGALLGDEHLNERARRAVASAGPAVSASPLAFAHLIGAAQLLERGAIELVVVGDRPDLVRRATQRFLPDSVLAFGERYDSPLWEGKVEEAAYVCRGGTCLAPVTDPDALDRQLDAALAARH